MKFHKVSAEDVKEIWRQTHARHVEAVLNHFAGHDRFLHFHVDRDPPTQLTDFLAPTFKINPDYWHEINRTKV